MHHVLDGDPFRSVSRQLYAHLHETFPPTETSALLLDDVRELVAERVREGTIDDPRPLESPELLVVIKTLLAELAEDDGDAHEDAAKLAVLLYLGWELVREIVESLPPK